MTALYPGGKARIVGNGASRHGFQPGTIVTLQGKPSNRTVPTWYVYGQHPNKDIQMPLYQFVAEADLEPYEAPADEPIYSEAQAAAVDREAERLDSLPSAPVPDPVKVLGDHYRLADDNAIASALRNLRFELAMRKKEAVDGR